MPTINRKTPLFITQSALISAIYIALTLFMLETAFGHLGFQIRFSEVLTILPLFTKAAIPGLFIGCVIANFFSPLGIVDVIFGGGASLIAAVLTYSCRNVKIKGFPALSFLPPILVNAAVVGIMLSIWLPDVFSSFFAAFASVGVGQTVVVTALGIPFYFLLKKSRIFERI